MLAFLAEKFSSHLHSLGGGKMGATIKVGQEKAMSFYVYFLEAPLMIWTEENSPITLQLRIYHTKSTTSLT